MALQRREFMPAAAGTALAGGLSGQYAAAESANRSATSEPYGAPTDVRTLDIANLNDLGEAAAGVLPPSAFAYIARGADNELTLRENREAFNQHFLRPHYLVGKPAPESRTTLMGEELSLPIIATPMGAHLRRMR